MEDLPFLSQVNAFTSRSRSQLACVVTNITQRYVTQGSEGREPQAQNQDIGPGRGLVLHSKPAHDALVRATHLRRQPRRPQVLPFIIIYFHCFFCTRDSVESESRRPHVLFHSESSRVANPDAHMFCTRDSVEWQTPTPACIVAFRDSVESQTLTPTSSISLELQWSLSPRRPQLPYQRSPKFHGPHFSVSIGIQTPPHYL